MKLTSSVAEPQFGQCNDIISIILGHKFYDVIYICFAFKTLV